MFKLVLKYSPIKCETEETKRIVKFIYVVMGVYSEKKNDEFPSLPHSTFKEYLIEIFNIIQRGVTTNSKFVKSLLG